MFQPRDGASFEGQNAEIASEWMFAAIHNPLTGTTYADQEPGILNIVVEQQEEAKVGEEAACSN